jgi:hypothetical protein
MISLSEPMTSGGTEVSAAGDSAVAGGVGEAVVIAGEVLPVGVGSGVCDAPTADAGVGVKLMPPTLTQINAVSIITADNKFVKTNMLNKKRRYAAIIYLWGDDKSWEKGVKKGELNRRDTLNIIDRVKESKSGARLHRQGTGNTRKIQQLPDHGGSSGD